MNPATIAFVLQIMNLVSAGITTLLPSIQSLVPAVVDMLSKNRAPTDAEWATLNSVTASLRAQLHDGSQVG